MKFCYVDESGKGNEPILVVAGIVTDSHRMHVTKKVWSDLIAVFADYLKKPVDEFHTKHFYRGNGIWRDLDGDQRTAVMNIILKWLTVRNHKVVFSAIDKAKADEANYGTKADFLTNAGKAHYWKLAILHLLLGIQKLHQGAQNNKGNTVLILDRGNNEEDIADLSLSPPAWTDSFYGYKPVVDSGKHQKPNPDIRFNQIIDVPFFADSKKVGLLQIADLFAYLLRRHAELQAGYTQEAYAREKDKVNGWIKQIATLMVPDCYRWPAIGGCDCSNWFKEIAPVPLLRVQKDFSA
jgi:hypothetical protein